MKTFVIAGALVLAGLGLAGSAAADCINDSPGLADYEYTSICYLEQQSYSYPPYYTQEYNSPVNAYYFGQNSNPYEYNYAQIYLAQYSGEQNWGSGPETFAQTYGGISAARYADGEYTSAGANFGDYSYDGQFYDYSSFGLGAYYQAGGDYQSLYYNQYNYSGGPGCQEYLYSYSNSGFEYIIAPQSCTVELPHIPAFPSQ